MKLKLTLLTIITAMALSATPVWNSGTYNLEIIEESAGYKDANTLSWYPVGQPTITTLLFAGLDGVGATASFTSPTSWGLMLDSPDGLFFSQPQFNQPADGVQHFLYSAGVVRIEDLVNGGDWDFDDLKTRLEVNPVPEPGTFLLMGLGLLGVGVLRRRRRSRVR